MSNYNAQLQSNNTSLRDLLQTVNNLSSGAGQAYSENEDAFLNGTLIGKYSNPNAQILGYFALRSYPGLTSLTLPNCTFADWGACNSALDLYYLSMTNLSSAAYGAFASCHSLKSVHLPNCSYLSTDTFREDIGLKQIALPACVSMGSRIFYKCHNLRKIEFSTTPIIGEYAFRECITLTDLRLGSSSVCTLLNSQTFYSTPYAGYSTFFSGTPHIYVPASLISSYQSATNWIYFSSYFSPLEEAPISFTIDGEIYWADQGMTWREWLNSDYNIHLTISKTETECSICGAGLEQRHDTGDGSSITTEESINDVIVDGGVYQIFCTGHDKIEIDGIEYPTDFSMTWQEWINSEYNTHPSISIDAEGGVACSQCGAWLEPRYGSEEADYLSPPYSNNDKVAIGNCEYRFPNSCQCNKITFTLRGKPYTTIKNTTWKQWLKTLDGRKSHAAGWNVTEEYVRCDKCGEIIWQIIDEDGFRWEDHILKEVAIMDLGVYGLSEHDCNCYPIYWFRVSSESRLYCIEPGMTWGEWCNSEYNTGGYSVMPNNMVVKIFSETEEEIVRNPDDTTVYCDQVINPYIRYHLISDELRG